MLKIRKLSTPLQATFWFVFATFLNKGIHMITTPLYTRLLTPSDYGVVSVYNTWSGIFSVVITLSIAVNAFNKGMVKFEEDRSSFISSMIGLTGLLVTLGFVIYKLSDDFFIELTGLSNELFYIMFAGLFLNVVLGFWTLDKKFNYEYKSVITVNISLSVISEIITYIAVVNAKDNLAFVKIFYNILPSYLVSIIFAIQLVCSGKSLISKKYWKFAFLFCIPLLPHYMSSHLLNQIDRIMIAKYHGTGDTAIYSVAYTLSSIIILLWSTISGVYVPWLYRNIEENNVDGIRKVSSFIITALVGGSLFIMLLAPEFMYILGPGSYAKGMYAIPPIIAGVYCSILVILYSNIEMYIGKNINVSIITIICAVINFVLNLIFIPNYGFVSAAYTTLVSYSIMFIFHRYNLKKLSNATYFNDKLIILNTIFLVLFSVVIQYTYTNVMLRLIMMLIIIGIVVHKRKVFFKIMQQIRE